MSVDSDAAGMPPRTPEGDEVLRAAAAEVAGGRLHKAIFLDEAGKPAGEFPSTQLPEDLFEGVSGTTGLQRPPFSLEQLVFLCEMHPVHSACIDQKTADIVGTGWEWIAKDGDEPSQPAIDKRNRWLESMSTIDTTFHEQLAAAWKDYERLGEGYLEVSRDIKGAVRRLYYVPGHTVRFHRDGQRLCQIRDARKVFFKRWGAPDPRPINMKTGRWGETNPDKQGGELLVITSPSARSSWYGIPSYISALGWIGLSIAARDDNLMFFANRREPRWAIILTNLDDQPNLDEVLRQAFTVDLKQPHRNIILPISGPGMVKFQQLSDQRNLEGSFAKLQERGDEAVLVAHRMPSERISQSKVGPLGGNQTVAASQVYKEAVVAPGQHLLKSRINTFIAVEYEKDETGSVYAMPYHWKPTELDLDRSEAEAERATSLWRANMVTHKEARKMIGKPPLYPDGDARNELLYVEIVPIAHTNADTPGIEPQLDPDKPIPSAPPAEGTSNTPPMPDANNNGTQPNRDQTKPARTPQQGPSKAKE